METTFGQCAIDFYQHLKLDLELPENIKVMNPYCLPKIRDYTRIFFSKFFSDQRARIFVFGINPGRFGAGTTGITFTDPVALEKFCGIENNLPKKRELSSIFVYKFINTWGGVEKFYKNFYLTATCPLGFIKEEKNLNFYDHPQLFSDLKPFIVQSIKSQLKFGANRQQAILLGTGKIKKIFETLNREYNFFQEIYALEHPRFIMQYKRKRLPYYLAKYHRLFSSVL